MANRPTPKLEDEKPTNPGQTQKSIPAYLAAALRIPTSYPLGANKVDEAVALEMDKSAVPGVEVIDFVPTLGASDSPVSALNRAAFNEFNAIRSQISGNRSYEPADHMIYRIAVSSMRNMYQYAARIYATVRTYEATNLYKPKAILDAMGLDADDWINNAADLYQWLLVNAGSLAPFPTVKVGSIDDRYTLFNSCYFTDGSVPTAQVYVMNQVAFWSYEKVDTVKGLTPRKFPATYRAFTTLWNAMYAALQSSSDVYIIAADIRRAFGDNVITAMTPPPVDASIEYHDVGEIKMAIMNASIVPRVSFANMEDDIFYRNFRIADNGGMLDCSPEFTATLETDGNAMYIPIYYSHLNVLSAEASPEELMHATRLHTYFDVDLGQGIDGNTLTVRVQHMGTEVVTGARILTRIGTFEGDDVYRTTELAGGIMVDGSLDEYGQTVVNVRTLEDLFRAASDISNFDWHHPISVGCSNMSEYYTGSTPWFVIEDIQNYVPVTKFNMQTIYDALLLAEFHVNG